jgi:hypothetical protein
VGDSVLHIIGGGNGQVPGLVLMIRDRFIQTRSAVTELIIIKAQLEEMGDDWKPETVKGGGISNPTESRAIYELDVLADMLEQLKTRERELIGFIGTTLAIIDGVRRGLGNEYAEILDQRYIGGLKWADVRIDGEPISPRTGRYKLGIAFDWIDSLGLAAILKGDYEL